MLTRIAKRKSNVVLVENESVLMGTFIMFINLRNTQSTDVFILKEKVGR